jgi:SAM-dependent methyltransferase
MRPEQDAYGEIIRAIHYGSDPDAGEIIEREDGYIEYGGSAENYFEPYEEWSDQIKEAVEHTHGSVVDVGCGAGRHSLHLQEKGLDVHGIDV